MNDTIENPSMRQTLIYPTRRIRTFLLMVALVFAPAASNAAGGGNMDMESPATLERIPGSDVPRITLTAKAAERLGIETATVEEAVIERTQVVGGVIVPAAEGMSLQHSENWVRVRLSEVELSRLARERAARLLPLLVGSHFRGEILAEPLDIEPEPEPDSFMLSLYYAVPADTGLQPSDRLRVKLTLAGSSGMERVVPYSAVYYDSTGKAWVYVTDAQFVYERKAIVIDRIAGDLVVLSEGPPLGTSVVSVGSALLYGAEIFGK